MKKKRQENTRKLFYRQIKQKLVKARTQNCYRAQIEKPGSQPDRHAGNTDKDKNKDNNSHV